MNMDRINDLGSTGKGESTRLELYKRATMEVRAVKMQRAMYMDWMIALSSS